MQQPLITVGIPAYNAEKYLQLAIDSVLGQTFADFELLLANDGSTDSTLQILQNYQDNRIRIIDDGRNRGLIYRLNEMITLSKGKYFARMDADDIMFPDRLYKQFTLLQSQPEAALSHSSALSINRENQILGIKKAGKVSDSATVLSGVFPIHPTVMGTIEYFRANPYREGFFQMEDMELWYRTVDKNIFLEIEEPLLFYREDSIKNSGKHRKMYKGLEKFAEEYISDSRQAAALLRNSVTKRNIYLLLEFLHLEKLLLCRRYSNIKNKKPYQNLLDEMVKKGQFEMKELS